MLAATLARRALLVLAAALVAGAALLLGPAAPAPSLGLAPAAAAAAPAPSPTPVVTPSTPSGEVLVRDETGTDLVLPILLGTVLVLVVGGLLFGSAVTRRQSQERRL